MIIIGFLLVVSILLLALLVYTGSLINTLKSELIEQESKAKFWEKQYKGFSKDEAISKEMILRKKYERLYHKSLDELDKLKDKRQFNGTKHLQRGNNRKTD
jgi:hypothetical protein